MIPKHNISLIESGQTIFCKNKNIDPNLTKNLSQLAKNFSITKLFLFYKLQKYTRTWKFLNLLASGSMT